MAVFVAQLVQRSLSDTEVHSSNPVIGTLLCIEHQFTFNCVEKIKIKKKEAGYCPFKNYIRQYCISLLLKPCEDAIASQRSHKYVVRTQFFKWAKLGLFFFIFVLFKWQIQHNLTTNEKAQIVCLRLEYKASGWLAQIVPLSYGGTQWTYLVVLNGPFPAYFSLFSSFQYS